MRIAYLTGTYPRATDTFVQREIAGGRSHYIDRHTFAIRHPADKQIVGQRQAGEREKPFYILPSSRLTLAGAHLSLLRRSPKRAHLDLSSFIWKGHAYGEGIS